MMNEGTGEQSHHDIRPTRVITADRDSGLPIETALDPSLSFHHMGLLMRKIVSKPQPVLLLPYPEPWFCCGLVTPREHSSSQTCVDPESGVTPESPSR